MTSARLLQAPWDKPDYRPVESWPPEGAVEFQGYSTRYREELDLAIKDVSFKTKPGEKVD